MRIYYYITTLTDGTKLAYYYDEHDNNTVTQCETIPPDSLEYYKI